MPFDEAFSGILKTNNLKMLLMNTVKDFISDYFAIYWLQNYETKPASIAAYNMLSKGLAIN